MNFGILVPLAPFIVAIAIVGIVIWAGVKNREETHKTIRLALEKGQPLPPEAIEALKGSGKKVSTAQSDLRTGVIWLAVALGIGAFGYFVGMEEGEAVYPLLGIASIPGMIGLAFIVLSFFNKNKA